MVKLKYGDGETPLRGEHSGFTFIPSNYSQSALISQPQARTRKKHQWYRMQCNQKAVRRWREMSATIQSNWETFAATYPQPSKKDANVFLTGYQLFIKRNFYKFLHDGINAEFITEPELTELPDPNFTASIEDNGMCLDVTEWYIKNFGILPQVGDSLICRIVPMAANSGQFFAPLIATLEVIEVFIDGLFLTLNFTGSPGDIVYSVYLSKPVRAGRKYPSTKFRYMGCFKPTQFIQLTDTPEDYSGQAGKFVAVKDTEDGVEFVDAGGGGVTCDDVCECPCIQTMQDQINNIGEVVSQEGNTSIPPIKRGLYYNHYLAALNTLITSSDDWVVPSYAEFGVLRNFVGGYSVGGGPLKENDLTYWQSPNAGATNATGFNGRGTGQRNYQNGLFSTDKTEGWYWCRDYYLTYGRKFYLQYDNAALDGGYGQPANGWSIRLMNPNTTLSDGETGTYVGNDGKIYRTVCIGTQEWLADNLAETKFRDGSAIPNLTDDAAWLADTNGAMCCWDNDCSNT